MTLTSTLTLLLGLSLGVVACDSGDERIEEERLADIENIVPVVDLVIDSQTGMLVLEARRGSWFEPGVTSPDLDEADLADLLESLALDDPNGATQKDFLVCDPPCKLHVLSNGMEVCVCMESELDH